MVYNLTGVGVSSIYFLLMQLFVSDTCTSGSSCVP